MIELCYWGVRGLGEVARYILRYSETQWDNKELDPNMERFAQWKEEKYTLGLYLPNLPYLKDGDINLTQSIAIVRYLGRKFGLAPSTEEEMQRCDLAEQEMSDFRSAFGRVCYDPAFDEKKEEYLKTLAAKLEVFDKFLGAGPFLLGNKITYVDFMVYEYFDQIKKLSPEHIAAAKNVTEFMIKFEKLPTLQKYFDSDEYKKGKYINSPFSMFPGK